MLLPQAGIADRNLGALAAKENKRKTKREPKSKTRHEGAGNRSEIASDLLLK
jgi:hypothetical protein